LRQGIHDRRAVGVDGWQFFDFTASIAEEPVEVAVERSLDGSMIADWALDIAGGSSLRIGWLLGGGGATDGAFTVSGPESGEC
jgi:hypothetical protein